ncbi:MAG: aldehyde dehydrogenase (NADP(+)) [Phycisphaeraceae bacterium]|nr:aldehyde dehydrogenase (NADP(+)) [Phycisphaeraceae bacterium]
MTTPTTPTTTTLPAAAPALASTMPRTPTGRSIIALEPAEPDPAGATFRGTLGADDSQTYTSASPAQVEAACRLAWEAYDRGALADPRARAALLEGAATRLAAQGDALLTLASAETGLSPPRLAGERDRTVNQLRMFAAMVREGSWVEAIIERGNPARTPVPKPDLRRMLRPLGPVVVFGASNFPLAYSTAGGDTASALAAGCPVVIKGHPSHPGTGEMAAWALAHAARDAGLHPGVFSFLHAGGTDEERVGAALVRHPCIRAGGFTGSPKGGLALAAIAASRPDPIPFFAEMGSVNPVAILPGALRARAKEIAGALAASITLSAGQMCTCPGLVLYVAGDDADAGAFEQALREAMLALPVQPMLSERIGASWREGIAQRRSLAGVETYQAGDERPGTPTLMLTTSARVREHHALSEECFGPSTVCARCESVGDLVRTLAVVKGSLTGTLWTQADNTADAAAVLKALEAIAGRVLHAGVPTGVEVCPAMVHSGPLPASNRPDHTAVGSLAVRRWCRPVAYQNMPDDLLPPELREKNPMGIERLIDGARTAPARPGANA